VDWPHLIAQTISFSIVCALLYWFAYRPVLGMLQERRRRIEEALANAERIKADLAQIELQRQESLEKVHAQATKLIEEARAAAARVQEGETQKAIVAAQRIMDQARQTAQQDHDRMLAALKQEVGRLVVQTTAAVTGKILTPEDQQRLAEETASQFAN
jgi:F-type H+-transporting ATPase subunit b